MVSLWVVHSFITIVSQWNDSGFVCIPLTGKFILVLMGIFMLVNPNQHLTGVNLLSLWTLGCMKRCCFYRLIPQSRTSTTLASRSINVAISVLHFPPEAFYLSPKKAMLPLVFIFFVLVLKASGWPHTFFVQILTPLVCFNCFFSYAT